MTNDMIKFDLPKEMPSIIKVIGVGGGGSNAVNHMFKQGIRGVDFIVCNTDHQALDQSPIPKKIALGANLTEGRGAGAIPEVGKKAAIENLEEVKEVLNNNTKMVFITAGMGGGTGTGAAPIIAKAAKEMGILTVGIVTIPFAFEGRKRKQQAFEGLEELKKNVDTLLVISNEKLREMYGNLKLSEAFAQADNILTIAAKGIAEIITVSGYVNVDFEDVKTVMKNSGVAIMGSASASGPDRAIKAVQTALASPLLNDSDIEGASNILLYINSGTEEVSMDEISEITDYIQTQAGQTAEIIWGNGTDEALGENISVTVIATGFKTKPIEANITGAQPKKIVYKMEDEQPVAKVAPAAVVPNLLPDEPYLKTAEPVLKKDEPVVQKTEQVVTNSYEPYLKTIETPVEKVEMPIEKTEEIVAIATEELVSETPKSFSEPVEEPVVEIQEITATATEELVFTMEEPVTAITEETLVAAELTPEPPVEETAAVAETPLIEQIPEPSQIIEKTAVSEVSEIKAEEPVAETKDTVAAVTETAVLAEETVFTEELPVATVSESEVKFGEPEILISQDDLKTIEPAFSEFDTKEDEEPFMIVKDESNKQTTFEFDIKSKMPHKEDKPVPPPVTITAKNTEEEKQAVISSDSLYNLTSRVVDENRSDIESSEMEKIQQERIERLRQMNQKYKTMSGLAELEKEPAYKRRNVKLNNTSHSSENNISRFTLSDDKNENNLDKKTELRSNNSFLHDNVD